MTNILIFAGSARNDSFNKKLAKHAHRLAEQEAGIDATFIDLKDYPMPIYDGDVEEEQGKPQYAKALKELFVKQDGFIIASPEYNSSFSPLLKNTIDWISRPDPEDQGMLPAFTGKTALLLAASPGALGGLRGLVPLRSLLQNIGVQSYADQLATPKAHEAFDADGVLKDDKRLKGVVSGFCSFTKKVAG